MTWISEIYPTFGQVWPSSGGITACRMLNHRWLALIRGITRPVTLPEWLWVPPSYFYSTIFTGFLPQIGENLDFLPTSRQVWPSSGGTTACRCYNSTCLALYGCKQSDEHSQHDCRALCHTFTAPWWQVSCGMNLGNLSNFWTCLAIKWGYNGM